MIVVGKGFFGDVDAKFRGVLEQGPSRGPEAGVIRRSAERTSRNREMTKIELSSLLQPELIVSARGCGPSPPRGNPRHGGHDELIRRIPADSGP